MKQLLYILFAVTLFTACSSDDDENGEIQPKVEIKESSLDLAYNTSQSLTITGVNHEDCNWKSSDEFIATVSDGKIKAQHIGTVTIYASYENTKDSCVVTVTPINNFSASTVTDFGITEDELKQKIERPYDRFSSNGQTKTTDAVYSRSGYKITNSYYWEGSKLSGVRKKIISNDKDADVFQNILSSMTEQMNFVSTYSNTFNSYPKATVRICILTIPNKCYAIYEQTQYDILFETGKAPSTTNYIYFAKDLGSAKSHGFMK